MKARRTSLKDIARELKVSVTTVSFVLNGKGKEKGISETVSEKILKYVEEIGYKPNQLARSLRTGRSRIIVFMVEDISNSFFARLARLIEDIAYEKGYRILFCSSENDDRKSRELIDLFLERQVDGFIIIPSPGNQDTLEKLQKQNVPAVLFDRYFPELQSSYVVINNEESAYNATRHLIGNGFRKVAFITIDSEQKQMQDRLNGYRKAVQELGLKENVLVVPFKDSNANRNQEILKDFFRGEQEFDALLFATNYLTETGLYVIREHFPQMKDKCGMLSFDDTSFFKIHTPAITAIAQPLKEIAKELMEILLEQIRNAGPKNSELKQKVLKTELMVRESSLPQK